ncbi:hypothetical protein CCMA1212_005192, partial [Trichoderma ghanense]
RPTTRKQGTDAPRNPLRLNLIRYLALFFFPLTILAGGSYRNSSQQLPPHCVSETRIAKCAGRANEAAGSARNRGAPCRFEGAGFGPLLFVADRGDFFFEVIDCFA